MQVVIKMSRMMLAWLTGSQKAANSSRRTGVIVSMETNKSLKVTTLWPFLLPLKTNFTVEGPELSTVWFASDFQWTKIFSFHYVSGHLKVKLESMIVVFTDMLSCAPRRTVLLADVSRRKERKNIFSAALNNSQKSVRTQKLTTSSTAEELTVTSSFELCFNCD